MSPTNVLGLSVMLKGMQQPLVLILPAQEARDVLQDWASCRAKLAGGTTIQGRTVDGVDYAVRIDEIAGMHTFDPHRAQQGRTNVPHLLQRPNGSGV